MLYAVEKGGKHSGQKMSNNAAAKSKSRIPLVLIDLSHATPSAFRLSNPKPQTSNPRQMKPLDKETLQTHKTLDPGRRHLDCLGDKVCQRCLAAVLWTDKQDLDVCL